MPQKPLNEKDAEALLKAARSDAKPTCSRELGVALNPKNPVNPRTVRDRIISLRLQDKLALIYEENKAARGEKKPAPAKHAEQYFKHEGNGSSDTWEAKGTRIQTLDDLIEAAQIDTSVWGVKHYTVNKWEGLGPEGTTQELFQVKATFERKQEVVDLNTVRDAVVDAMREHSPAPVRQYKAPAKSGLAMDVLVPDLHLGKLAVAAETGQNYDGGLAEEALRHVLAGLLTHAQHMQVDRLIFPVGNDLLHIDNAENTTTAGTRQDTDTRYYRSTRRAVNLMVEAIDQMLQIAPVDVIVVPGNHARLHEQMLGEVMRAWYRRDPFLTLHDSPAPRKYLQHGKNLLGFTHGDGVKAADLPLLMAIEAPQMWAQTEYRTWLTGHLHQRRSNTFGSIAEHKGVEVKISPSLSASDAWHTAKGFIGNLRAAEGHVYSAEEGEIARFRATLPTEDLLEEAS